MKNVEDVYPLSPMQQGMLFHTLYDSGLYVEQTVCTLCGDLNITAFQRAWQQVIELHPILRTAFMWKDLEAPLQVVRQQVQLPWSHDDWSALPADAQAQRLADFLAADRARGFDLGRAPLMRLATFQIGPQRHYLVWSQHHILLDGWSLPLVLRDAMALYEGAVAGQSPQLPRPRPYRDFIAWLQQQDMAQAEAFWRDQLRGFRAATPLMVDRPASQHGPSSRYDGQELQLPTALASQLQTLAAQHGLTVNTLVQGAWALLLSRYSGEHEVVFGTTVSGRPAALRGVEGMVGLFINTLPVRVRLDPSQPLLAWLTELQAQQAELRQYEYTPLVQIQGWSEVPRGQPLFESLLVFENYPISDGAPGQQPSLLLQNMRSNEERGNYPLNMIVAPLRQGIAMRANYDTGRFDAATVARILGHLAALLASLARQPGGRLADLELLTEAEAQQLRAWNRPSTPPPPDACLHGRFAQQCRRTPGALAIASGDQQLSYAELDAQANQLAHALRAHGVGPEVRVGVCLARSIDLIVAMLGILKAGGAYVPLDPNYPAELLAYMLADSCVPLLITSSQLAARLPESAAARFYIDRERPTLTRQPTSAPPVRVDPDQVANVIYTSGSTGRPKGVLVTHGGLCNTIARQVGAFEVGPGSQVLQFAPFSFDASVSEIMMALCAGATLQLAAPDDTLAGTTLRDVLAQRQISHVTLPPSALLSLPDTELPNLGTIVVAGERCPAELTERWAAERRLFNAYGPTEAAICATIERCVPGGAPPIGRPLENTHAFVLDPQLRLVPIGVPGELYLAGAGLARGYLNRPDLTAERFVPNPFATPTRTPAVQHEEHEGHEEHEEQDNFPTQRKSALDDQPVSHDHAAESTSLKPQASSPWHGLKPQASRLYATGDLARYLADGRLEFIGRRDHQVKLRGYRIELGQIEATLAQHPAVRETVVLAREDTPGDPQLVAYLTPAPDQQISSAALRELLTAQLPSYMVPAALVVLEDFPRTPSNKIDRKALPAPTFGLDADAPLVPPRTPIEELLAGIWSEVLHIPRVGVHDSFFTLGGHSLNATQVLSRLRMVLQVDLPLRALFEAPTIAELAERIQQARTAPALLPPPLVPQEHPSVLPLSFAQQRLWFLDQLDPNSSAYAMPSALRIAGPLNRAALQDGINAVLARHTILRTTFTSDNGQAAQQIHPFEPLELVLTDLSDLPPAERETMVMRLVETHARRPFDLSRGPLFRAALLCLDADAHVLLLNMHHIVSDGWSASVMIRELLAVYKAVVSGRDAALGALPIQYADYALWQRAWLQGAVLEAQLAYWRQQLADLSPLDLPTDYARPSVATLRGTTHPFAIAPHSVAALGALCRRAGVTPFMALLAVWQLLLARWSGQDDIAVGTPIAGRNQQATEPLIGCFINTLVLRSDLAQAASFRDLLGQVREVCLAAFAHQDVPFEQLVDLLEPTRDLSRHPLFQVMFTLQAAPAGPLSEAGLTLTPLEIAYGTAKFDLSLSLSQQDAGLMGVLEYSTDLFDGTTAARLAAHYTTLLAALLAAPDQPLARISVLTPAEQAQLATWAQTAPAAAWQGSLPSRLLAQAARTPQALALIDAHTRWSYAELQDAAQHLAAHLAALPRRPDQPIAVLLERTVTLPAAFLAVWLVGAPLLPLDPSQPPARLAQLLRDAQPAHLLTSAALAASLPQELPSALVVHDVAVLLATPAGAAPVAAVLAPETPAYLLYTSGSTGQPKAVRASHGSLIGILDAISALIGYQPGDVQPWLASAAFDISLFELFAPLLAGATTRLLSRAAVLELAQDPRPLAHWSVLHAVPSLLRVLLSALESQPQLPRTLRQVLVGGDRVPPDLLTQVQQVLPDAACTVLYGPTETTILATAYVVPPEASAPHAWLGRPLAGVEVRLCDRHGQLVPIGVVGELWIGGVGVSQGYLNQPELTAERFVVLPSAAPTRLPNIQHEEHEGHEEHEAQDGHAPHRQSARDGHRVPQHHAAHATSLTPQAASLRFYRSGDLARYLPDGTLVFVGRQDGQVKLRGFRIELGEIEAVLSRHPAVAEALVRVGQVGATPQLVAYVVPRADSGLESEALRTFVGTQLPDYMVPSAVITLDRFPLTPNGKLDLRALPTPEQPAAAQAVAPRTPIETTLATIWAEVLRVPTIGIHDNFFHLGGDSILSIQIVARAGQAGLRLTPRQLFQHQTIAELAAVAAPTGALQAEQGLVQGGAPLTPIQRWFLRQELPAPHHFNLDLLFTVSSRIAPAALAAALQALLAHHDALRLRFQQADGAWQAHHAAPPTQPPLTVLDLQAVPVAQRAAVQQAACAAFQASLDLSNGPLLRALLLEWGPDQPQRLLLVVHHLVIDVVSWGVLLADLRQAVALQQAGQPIQLPPKTSAWRDWASQLHQYAHNERVAAELPFWQPMLAAALPPMPRDYPQGRNTMADMRHLHVALDAAETSALLQTVPPVYQTRTPEVLLTALVQLWQQWTGQAQLCLSLEGHGREAELVGELDLSRTVGWFTTIYPLLLTLPPDDDAGAALKAIKEQVRQLPQHGLGYGLLRELTGALTSDPPVELSFNYLGQVDQTLGAANDWTPAGEPAGPAQHPTTPRAAVLDITIQIRGGQLLVGWTYSAQLHTPATIAWLADRYLTALRRLIAHCASPEAGGFTPSDFAEYEWDQDDLDDITTAISKSLGVE